MSQNDNNSKAVRQIQGKITVDRFPPKQQNRGRGRVWGRDQEKSLHCARVLVLFLVIKAAVLLCARWLNGCRFWAEKSFDLRLTIAYSVSKSGFKTSDQVPRLNPGLHVFILTN